MNKHKPSRMLIMLLALLCACGGLAACKHADRFVTAGDETVNAKGDPDDPAIWINPADPAQSLIIGTDKSFGLLVFDLEGNLVQEIGGGQYNNVDLRPDFPFGAQAKPLVVTTNRSDTIAKNTIACYVIDEATGALSPAATPLITVKDKWAGGAAVTGDIYGIALYRSAVTDDFYVFVNFYSGWVVQLRLTGREDTTLEAAYERSWQMDSLPEGMAADDELGHLYVGEEQQGLWKFPAEPGEAAQGVLVDFVGSASIPAPDVEGIAIYKTGPADGFLIVSSQGDSSYCVYDRAGANDFVFKFSILAGPQIDRVTETDGLEVTPVNLGASYPEGMLVVQDDLNEGFSKNFKMVSWRDIAAIAPAAFNR